MSEKLTNLQNLKENALTKKEIEWLGKFTKAIFKNKVTEKDIIFTKKDDKYLTYFLCKFKVGSVLDKDSIPKKFLENEFIVMSIKGIEKENEYYTNIDLVYWYIDHVKDILDYKDLLDRIFEEAMTATKRDKYARKGYKIYDIHFKKICKDWKAIDMTLLLGFAIYIKLFKRTTRKSLERMYKGFDDQSLEYIGLSEADREDFGKVNHYERLGLCWYCGRIKTNGLCKECKEFWDEMSK